MKLNFRIIGEGEPLIVLHGLFGSADNWQTIARELGKHYKCYLVDQRNHGNSPHSKDINYHLMSEDLRDFMIDEGVGSAHVLGHSMGGKTAMNFATLYPNMVQKLIIVDISPKNYPPHHEQIFRGFRSIDLSALKSRKEADEQLSATISDFGVRQFMLKNLTREGDSFKWKINLDAIESNANEVGKALDSAALFEGETLFIGGTKSDYIAPTDYSMISKHFPKATIEMVEGAGHWVHAEKPKELINHVITFLA